MVFHLSLSPVEQKHMLSRLCSICVGAQNCMAPMPSIEWSVDATGKGILLPFAMTTL